MLPRFKEDRCRYIATLVLLFANIVYLFTGLTFIGLGLIFLLLQKTILAVLPFSINLFAAPLITIGALVYVITALGFFSAWNQWRSLLVPYALCMALLVIFQGCVVVATWGKLDRVGIITQQWVFDAFQKPEMLETFHLLEMSLQCCGTYGALSYADIHLDIPSSCCEVPMRLDLENRCFIEDTFRGCAPIVSAHLELLAGVADSSLFYAIAVEILALIASVYLLRTTKKHRDDYRLVDNNNLQDNRTNINMAQMQLVTSQPGRQIVYQDTCEQLV